MLGHYLRKELDYIYPHLSFLSKVRISPNMVSVLSLLPALFAAILIFKKMYLLATIFVILSLVMDIVDGALARANNKSSKFGDYFDAMVDRYREVIFYMGFVVSGYFLEAFIALSGSLIVSFAKARTAMCVSIDDHDWPAIGDMADRNILLIVGLVVASIKPVWLSKYKSLSFTLILIGVVTYIGSIFRIIYAKKLISSNDNI